MIGKGGWAVEHERMQQNSLGPNLTSLTRLQCLLYVFFLCSDVIPVLRSSSEMAIPSRQIRSRMIGKEKK